MLEIPDGTNSVWPSVHLYRTYCRVKRSASDVMKGD